MPRSRTTSDAAILAATARAIAKSGPANLTLATVASEVGLAPATLVQRFGSKRGLLLALAHAAETEVARTFEKARAGRGPVDALHAALADVASGVRSREELANNIAFLQMDVADPQFRKHAANHAWAMRREIAALLAEGVEIGELRRKDCDIAQLARAVQIAYNGSLIGWALTGDGSLTGALRTDVEHVLLPYRN